MMSSTTIFTAGSVILSGEDDTSLQRRESQLLFSQDSVLLSAEVFKARTIPDDCWDGQRQVCLVGILVIRSPLADCNSKVVRNVKCPIFF